MLFPPTKEQKEILKALEWANVSVDAVAGSGKTTTILPKPTRRNDAPSLRHKNVPCLFGTQPSATNVLKPNFRAYPNQ